MKILRLFLASTFILSILLGVWIGRFIFPHKSSPHQDNTLPQTTRSAPVKQDGIWLIAVDRLNHGVPQIKGVWLVTYITGYMKLKSLPLFPSDNPQHDAKLANSFQLTKDNQIAPAFWENLKEYGQLVQNYIVFDENAAVEIINFFGGVTIEGKHLNGIEIFTQTKNTRNDPQLLIKRQTAIMDSLCKSIFNNQPVPDFAKLQRKIKNHILTNLDLGNQSIEFRKFFLDGGQKICEFPELYGKSPVSSKP